MVGKYGFGGTARKLKTTEALIISIADRQPFSKGQLPYIMRAIEKAEEIEENEGI